MNNKDVFDSLADRYDAWYDSEDGRPLYESELLSLKSLIEDVSSPMLEIGVGTGRFAMRFPDVFGVDPSVKALEMAEKRGIKTVQATGEKLPFKDKIFRYVLIIVTLCFVDNPLAVLREAERVLRPDGSIIIGLVPKDSPWGLFYEEKKKEGHPFYRNAKFYTLKDTENLLKAAGLKISRVSSTLLQRPDESRRIEAPMKGYVRDAGFICIEAKRAARCVY